MSDPSMVSADGKWRVTFKRYTDGESFHVQHRGGTIWYDVGHALTVEQVATMIPAETFATLTHE